MSNRIGLVKDALEKHYKGVAPIMSQRKLMQLEEEYLRALMEEAKKPIANNKNKKKCNP